MRVIDLTHCITEHMPVYPGTEAPVLYPGSSYEKDGFRETVLKLYSHTGTHMDAPNHIFSHGATLDAFPVAHFVGRGLVIDCRNVGAGGTIGIDQLEAYGAAAEEADYLLFHTGWSSYWGQDAYFGAYPCLENSLIDHLILAKKKGIGLDTISLDPMTDDGLTRHHRLFSSSDTLVIENLTNLEQMGSGLFTLIALPLRFHHSDGAPVRVIGILDTPSLGMD